MVLVKKIFFNHL